MKFHTKICVMTLVVLVSARFVAAEDESELEGMKIIGNPELPKALAIVPWKVPSPGDLGGKIGKPEEELLAPIDREEFTRELEYANSISKQ